MSQFAFLQSEWSFLWVEAQKVEEHALADPRAACMYARCVLENAMRWLYQYDACLKAPYETNLSSMLHEASFKQTAGNIIFKKADALRLLGNDAAHGKRQFKEVHGIDAARELFHFCYWLARSYSRKAPPAPGLQFSPALLPEAKASVIRLKQAQLQALEQQLREQAEKLATEQLAKQTVEQELEELRSAISAAKKANDSRPDTHDYNEAETRDLFIDLLLSEAGWAQGDNVTIEVPVTGMPNANGQLVGPGLVDYVLSGKDGKPLAVIEAKRCKVDSRNGQHQAKLYADCLEKQYGQRPLIFFSNGYEHWLWDDQSGGPRPIAGFHKPDELALLMQRRSSRTSLLAATISSSIAGRYYQQRAIRKIAESFEAKQQRKALLVMATGAGKTRTVIALADLLIRCNWVKRVLFLADRLALVKQAVGQFKIHLPDSAPVNLCSEKGGQGRVYISTYPSMMGLIDEYVGPQRRFGPGHFDLIVIDEAHRSVYQKYKHIFRYFDAPLVGLTATPTEDVDRDTYRLFDLEPGMPTDAYDLTQAIADKNLVPMRAFSVPTRFQREGIRYADLSEEDKERWDEIEWNEDGTAPDKVEASALNEWLFNIDTVDIVLHQLMKNGVHVGGGDDLGKTIIFAKNKAHAQFIDERFNANYPQYNGLFARIITHDVKYVQNIIDDFSKKDSLPRIAISVDMLDTGIDVPEVVNLVFFKAVYSKTKFWQMIGRGTRLCPNLFGPGKGIENDKQDFWIFDYCMNFEYFGSAPPLTQSRLAASLGTKLFQARVEMLAEMDKKRSKEHGQQLIAEQVEEVYLDVQSEPQLRAEIARGLRQRVAAMNLENFIVRPERKMVEKYAAFAAWGVIGVNEADELSQHVAALPSALKEEDEEAKRFDLLLLKAQLAVLQGLPTLANLREKIQGIAQLLQAQANVPAIAKQMHLISEIISDEWWQDVNLLLLEKARRHLRDLIKLIEKTRKNIVYSDFADELRASSEFDLLALASGLDLTKFKIRARQFFLEHENHLAVQRLRRNQALTPSDLQALEEMLKQAGASQALLAEAKSESENLGLFIRSLVGLEREAVVEAFSQFVQDVNANATQIEFVEMLIEHLCAEGVMSAERLYESPFTDLCPQGPESLFPAGKVDLLVGVLTQIKLRAA